ncbi:MAG: hypothetical protein A3F46_02225 [Legionellales bacterium RIFCSPHIGHO2_12_FULL_42_9]|nr:MAG: hypothetical protein A3F46_02225 [Legionellales bacterium RIFCSPHIGHO2_12_FULL_42_9]
MAVAVHPDKEHDQTKKLAMRIRFRKLILARDLMLLNINNAENIELFNKIKNASSFNKAFSHYFRRDGVKYTQFCLFPGEIISPIILNEVKLDEINIPDESAPQQEILNCNMNLRKIYAALQYDDSVSQIASFLGLPNKLSNNQEDRQTWTNIFNNFIGRQQKMHWLMMPVTIAFNCGLTAMRFANNLIKSIIFMIHLIAMEANNAAARHEAINEHSIIGGFLYYVSGMSTIAMLLLKVTFMPVQWIEESWCMIKTTLDSCHSDRGVISVMLIITAMFLAMTILVNMGSFVGLNLLSVGANVFNWLSTMMHNSMPLVFSGLNAIGALFGDDQYFVRGLGVCMPFFLLLINKIVDFCHDIYNRLTTPAIPDDVRQEPSRTSSLGNNLFSQRAEIQQELMDDKCTIVLL